MKEDLNRLKENKEKMTDEARSLNEGRKALRGENPAA